MRTTAAQNQRMIDDAAEIEELAEKLKVELKADLSIDSHFEVTGGTEEKVIDRWNVVDAMRDLDDDAFLWAVITQDKAILKALKAQAIEKIVADTDLTGMAAWEFKQTEVAA